MLLVEDSERLRRTLGAAFRHAGYAADLAADGEEGLWLARSNDYDVIVLDIMLPRLDGMTVLSRLREAGRDTHVLLLTAKDAVDDRVRGLRAGADDYLVKPFALDELLARVEALVRRRHGSKQPRLRFGHLELDTAGRCARRAGRRVELSPREYALLHYLALHPGEVVSRTQIEAATYDEQAEPMSNVVDAAIYALRKKIDDPGAPSLIQTRRGMGYVFQPHDDDAGPDTRTDTRTDARTESAGPGAAPAHRRALNKEGQQ
jgi:DNA-binding response OmpR family regulator